MNRFRERLKRNQVWSFGVFVSDEDFSFDRHFKELKLLVDSKRPRLRRGHVHTAADPFLFVHDDELYIFYEKQSAGDHGVIEAVKTRDLENFESLGEILREAHHVSYPCVVRDQNSIFLVSESQSAGAVNLYRFEDFPSKPVRFRKLINGPYQDPSLTFHNGHWYLFATKEDRLELFVSRDLEKGEFVPHPCNPISSDLSVCRCGGGVFANDGMLFRLAQEGSIEYGRNLNILKILELSPTVYREELYIQNYLKLDQRWNARGGHHLSVAEFLGKTVVATDGRQDDLLLNRFLSVGWRAINLTARVRERFFDLFRKRPESAATDPQPKFTGEIS